MNGMECVDVNVNPLSKRWIIALAPAIGWAACALTAGAQSPSEAKVVVPFDFVSQWDKGRYGQMVGEMIWKKLDRQKGFVIPASMQDVREVCSENNVRILPDMPLEKVQEVVRKNFDAQIAIWGSVERAPGTDGEIYDLSIRCVDFSGPEPKVIYEKTNVRTNSVSEIPHLYVQEMLDKLYGRKPGGPPPIDPGAEERWKTGPSLVVGDFESGARGVPKGWEPVGGQKREPLGNLVKWTAEAGNSQNRVIRFTFPASVGDDTGVPYYSDWFPVQEGATYRFQCRWRTNGPAVKVFIKCYEQFFSGYVEETPSAATASTPDPVTGSQNSSGRRGEVYRSQQNLKGPKNTWNLHTEDFTPHHSRFSPKWGKVMLFAYLGGGAVEFDDVVLKQIVPPPSENLNKDLRPSAASKVSVREMEENERRGKQSREKMKKEGEKRKEGMKDEG